MLLSSLFSSCRIYSYLFLKVTNHSWACPESPIKSCLMKVKVTYVIIEIFDVRKEDL